MKVFDFPCRVFNSESLTFIGDYKPGEVAVVKSRGRKLLCMFLPMLIILLWLVPFVMWIPIHEENEQLREEIEVYEKTTDLSMSILGTEYLAGKYATFKGAVPEEQDTIFRFVCECGAWYPEIIMAQLILESRTFGSDVGENAKNGFGMKKCGEGPKSRSNLQIPGVNYKGYGIYMNWYHSILDRHMWDLWIFKGEKPTLDKYLEKIGSIYAEDPDYISKVLRLANEWKPKADAYLIEIAEVDTLQ